MNDSYTAFKQFLQSAGARLLPTTNEWERVRFKCPKGTGIVYERKNGNKSFSGPAHEAWKCFCANKPWSIAKPVNRAQSKEKASLIAMLRERDGEGCFYCGRPFRADDPATIEHLLCISHGGGNHAQNLALAHRDCNQHAGNRSLHQKIQLRESLRQQVVRRSESVTLGSMTYIIPATPLICAHAQESEPTYEC